MATKIRSKISKKKDYWISKHRYYELKHFCLQYPEWKKECACATLGLKAASYSIKSENSQINDPTSTQAINHILRQEKMLLIERTAYDACGDLADYILKNVTLGIGYTELVPCSKNTYYDRYRKFFALLSSRRN